MKMSLVLNRFNDWLVSSSRSDSRLFHTDDADYIMICPSQAGQGYHQSIPLRDDLFLTVHDYTLYQPLVIDVLSGVNYLEFEFQLAGHNAGYSSFGPYFGIREFNTKPSQRRYFNVEVWFKGPALAHYYQALIERLSPPTQSTAKRILQSVCQSQGDGSGSTLVGMLSQIFEGTKVPGSRFTLGQILTDVLYGEAIALRNGVARSPLTPAMEQVIGRILSCPYQGATRRRYLTRQALTLVELYLKAIVQRHRQEADLDYVYQAGTILRKQMANPPSVAALARQVGTNRLTLNQGFRKLYGMTPFSYLHNYRLEQARRLLMTSDLSIQKVAAAVGYTSRSNFALSFRQKTGLNPKTFQMEAWQGASNGAS